MWPIYLKIYHTILEKFWRKRLCPKMSRKRYTMQHIPAFIRRSVFYGMDWNGMEEFCHIISWNRAGSYRITLTTGIQYCLVC